MALEYTVVRVTLKPVNVHYGNKGKLLAINGGSI
jgi:hypothetical protein